MNQNNLKKINHYLDNSIANPFMRLLARLLDSIIVSIISIILFVTLVRQQIDKPFSIYYIISQVLTLFFTLLVFIIFPKFVWKGQTIGKKICRIKIVDDKFNDVSFKKILIREIMPTGLLSLQTILLLSFGNDIYSKFLNSESTKTLVEWLAENYPSRYWVFYIIGILQITSSFYLLITFILMLIVRPSLAIHDRIASTKVISISKYNYYLKKFEDENRITERADKILKSWLKT